MAFGVACDFDGGRLGDLIRVADKLVVARIHRDWDHERRCYQATWYAARLTGLAGQPATIELRELGSVYNGRPNAGGIVQEDWPAVSDDGVAWRRVDCAIFDAAARTLTLHLTPAGDELWVANLEPYTAAHLAALAADLAACPAFSASTCGTSLEGRPLPLWTIGHDDAERCVWLMARQHAWETHTSWCLDGLARWLVANVEVATRRVVWKLLPWCEPDGVVAGASRFNRLGWDTNRHWDTTEPTNPDHLATRPEICGPKGALLDWLAAGRPIDLFLSFHDTQRDVLFVPHQLADDPLLLELHRLMRADGFEGNYHVRDDQPSGCVQNALASQLGVRAALVELGTAYRADWGRPPAAADQAAFGARLGQTILNVGGG